MQYLIREATAPDLILRTESASDFLANLDKAEDELTSSPKESLADPLDARKGDLLPHRLKVLRRLGGGTSAVALLVQRDDEILVLKYAREAKDNDRLRREHEILASLRHELIVTCREFLAFPDGNAGFLMEYAGEWDRKKPGLEDQRTEAVRDTLAREIKAFGRLSLELLVRYGEDLLNVVRYLEEKGVAHRDLKPENIGIKEYAKKLHLKVFDFSLSSAPLDNVRVGTPPYLEPFLQLRRHPWSIGGGGAAELKSTIEASAILALADIAKDLGRTTHTGEDDAFYFANASVRTLGLHGWCRPLVMGEDPRDWQLTSSEAILFPYDAKGNDRKDFEPVAIKHYWSMRTRLRNRRDFGQTIEERGIRWQNHSMFFRHRFVAPLVLAFGNISTHNNFVLDRGGKVFNSHAPTITLPPEASEDEHLEI
jgi:serine/threonine protein kinase